ncbi:MAG: zinc ribbon domain-containing protein [Chloroflexi bacterium]|nr:zinc ribbon domain-containing protein [Chloroflexota bacterium]
MPIYEYGCAACGEVSSVLLRSYSPPDSVACERCGNTATQRLVSRVAYKMAYRPKYGEDFTEKALPFLKSKFKKEFAEGGAKESEEAKAFRINEAIGEQMDRVITKQMKEISQRS